LKKTQTHDEVVAWMTVAVMIPLCLPVRSADLAFTGEARSTLANPRRRHPLVHSAWQSRLGIAGSGVPNQAGPQINCSVAARRVGEDQPGSSPLTDPVVQNYRSGFLRYVPNATYPQVADFLANYRKLQEMLNEICALNAELLRRRESLD
jgi:hypothetical protein